MVRSVLFQVVLGILIITITSSCAKYKCPLISPSTNPEATIAQWTAKSSGIAGTYIDVYEVNPYVIYICGYEGLIIKSTDGGNTWTKLNSGTTADLITIWFINTNTGFVAGGGGVLLKTVDGGATWTSAGPSTSNNYTNLLFTDSNTGYACGNYGYIIKTTDGGSSWITLPTGTTETIYALYFVGNIGYACGYDFTIFKTLDGGATWTELNSGLAGGPSLAFVSIYFKDVNTGYVVGGNGDISNYANSYILKTTDGGMTWTQQTNPAKQDYLRDIYFTSTTTGYIAGGNILDNTSTILKTTDGGSTWIIKPTSSARLSKFSFSGSSSGISVGLNSTILKGN